MSTIDDKLISVSDAADVLGVSRQRVLQLIDLGKLGARKIAGVYLISRPDVTTLKKTARKPGRPSKAVKKGKSK